MMSNYHPNSQMSVFKSRSQIKRHFSQLSGRGWWLVKEVQRPPFPGECVWGLEHGGGTSFPFEQWCLRWGLSVPACYHQTMGWPWAAETIGRPSDMCWVGYLGAVLFCRWQRWTHGDCGGGRSERQPPCCLAKWDPHTHSRRQHRHESLFSVCARSVISHSATPWIVAHQASLSMGFSRQEYWSGLPCPPPGTLPDPGNKLASLESPALAGRFFTEQQAA